MERECLNNLIQTDNGSDTEACIRRVVKMLLGGEYEDIPVGVLADGTPYRISEYDTQDAKDCIIESHRNHIDVQFVISGSEWINLYAGAGLTSVGEYNAEADAEFWRDGIIEARTIMRAGSVMVIKSNVPHMGCVQIDGPEKVKRLVCKIEV